MKQRLSDNVFIASAFMALVMIICSCNKQQEVQQAVAPLARDQMPALLTDSVTTLISDSGITRYRIEAPQWCVYDRAQPKHQEFPQGIYLEQFDENLSVIASLKADYAYYDEEAQRWTLTGNVHALNHKGEQFDTPELNWDQREHRVYSEQYIHITREKSVIEGVGFDSNEEMTKYTILHPTGVFPIDDKENPVETEENKEE